MGNIIEERGKGGFWNSYLRFFFPFNIPIYLVLFIVRFIKSKQEKSKRSKTTMP